MIKWFKSIFNEDEDNQIQNPVNEIDTQEMHTKENPLETARTIERDRRFRFPLVPDEMAAGIQEDLLPKKEILTKPTMFANPYAEQKEITISKSTEPVEEVADIPVFKRRENHKDVKEEKEDTKKTEEVTIKKPFRLTEIPSPVYGFKRPNTPGIAPTPTSQSQIQQNEIDEILRKNRNAFIKEEQPVDVQNDEVVEFELPTSLSFLEELGIENSDEEVIYEVEEVEHRLESEVENDCEVEKDREEELYNLKEVEEVETNKVETEPEVSVNTKPYNVEIENNIQIHLHHQGNDPLANTRVEKSHEPIIEVVEEKESTTKSHMEVETASDENEKEVTEERAVTEETTSETESLKQSQEELKKETEKKRHIPFNVMMLRKDKEALARKEQVSVSGQVVTTIPIENVQTQTEVIVHDHEESKVKIQEETLPEKKVEEIVEVMSEEPDVLPSYYEFPSEQLLEIAHHAKESDDEWVKGQWDLLDKTLFNFNVGAKVINVTQGPAVTRFEVQPEPGVKVNKITNLTDDIKLNLSAKDIRIEAPIPGKNAVGIEVPNKKSNPVFLREILETSTFKESVSPLTIALGLDISGNPIVADIRKMPHGLIAGATGSGKSVCINSLLVSILYKALPQEVKLLLIDPKMVELAPYNHIPHLVSPVITDAKAATAALKWAVEEMDRRYELFAHAGARDLVRYNELAVRHKGETLPYLVIIIDELADLMMVAPGDVEESICRIAQKARACGIHLIVATQRPSVDVITGLIKANIPTRTAFTVSSQVDSRTIIDTSGAEKLLGRGDMLFLNNGESKPIRVQGVYVSDDEIERVVSHVKEQMAPNYLFKQDELLTKVAQADAEDELYLEACEYVVEQEGASASMLQRRFRIGYNRAARLIELMESRGIISEAKGSKPREVLISHDDLVNMLEG